MKKNNQKKNKNTSLTRKIFSAFNRVKTIFKKDKKELKNAFKPFDKLNQNLENVQKEFPKFAGTKVFKNVASYVDKINSKMHNINAKLDSIDEKISKDDEEFLKSINPSMEYLQSLSNKWVEYLSLKKDKINLVEKNISNISSKAKKVNEGILEKIKPSVDHFKDAVKTLNEQIDEKEIKKLKKIFDKWKITKK